MSTRARELWNRSNAGAGIDFSQQARQAENGRLIARRNGFFDSSILLPSSPIKEVLKLYLEERQS